MNGVKNSMAKVKVLVTQTGADTFTSEPISTGMTLEGKTGWQVTAIQVFWADGSAVAAADWSISATLATVDTETAFGDADEITRISWGLQNTAGVAVAVPYEPQKENFLIEPRITVQPQIYAGIVSSGTGQANDIIMEVYYETVKLSDLEVMRLYAVGA